MTEKIKEWCKSNQIKNEIVTSFIIIGILVMYYFLNIEIPLKNIFMEIRGYSLFLIICFSILEINIMFKYERDWEIPLKKMMEIQFYLIWSLIISFYLSELINYWLIISLIIAFICKIILNIEISSEKINQVKEIEENTLEYELEQDVPVLTKDDLFESRKQSLRIVRQIQNKSTKESFAIGINGLWGTGKTSMINAIRNDEDKKYEYIYVSVMQVSKWSELIDYYYLELKRIFHENNIYTGLNDSLKKYFGLIQKISEENSLAKNIFEFVGETSFLENKKKLVKKIKYLNRKICFIVDDLERLEKNQVREVLFFLREILNLEETMVLIIADKNLLESCFKNSNYIDKFVNEWINIPDVDSTEILDYYCETKSIFSRESMTNYLNKSKEAIEDVTKEVRKRNGENVGSYIDNCANNYKDTFENMSENINKYYKDIFEALKEKLKTIESKNEFREELEENKIKIDENCIQKLKDIIVKENESRVDDIVIQKLKNIIAKENNIRFIKKYLNEIRKSFLILILDEVQKESFRKEHNISKEIALVSFEKFFKEIEQVNRSTVINPLLLDKRLKHTLDGEQRKIYDLLINFNKPDEIKSFGNLKKDFINGTKENRLLILSEYLDGENLEILSMWLKDMCNKPKEPKEPKEANETFDLFEESIKNLEKSNNNNNDINKVIVNLIEIAIGLHEFEYSKVNDVLEILKRLIDKDSKIIGMIDINKLMANLFIYMRWFSGVINFLAKRNNKNIDIISIDKKGIRFNQISNVKNKSSIPEEIEKFYPKKKDYFKLKEFLEKLMQDNYFNNNSGIMQVNNYVSCNLEETEIKSYNKYLDQIIKRVEMIEEIIKKTDVDNGYRTDKLEIYFSKTNEKNWDLQDWGNEAEGCIIELGNKNNDETINKVTNKAENLLNKFKKLIEKNENPNIEVDYFKIAKELEKEFKSKNKL